MSLSTSRVSSEGCCTSALFRSVPVDGHLDHVDGVLLSGVVAVEDQIKPIVDVQLVGVDVREGGTPGQGGGTQPPGG